MRFLLKTLSVIIAAPFEFIKKPVLIITRLAIILLSFSTIVAGLFAAFTDHPGAPTAAVKCFIVVCVLYVLSYAFEYIIARFSPISQWLRQREEDYYYDKEYRLDEYKNNRRWSETGFNEWQSQEDVYYIMKAIEEQNRNIRHLNNVVTEKIINQ